MKKILFTLVMSLSFTTVMANSFKNTETVQNLSVIQKAPANSGIHKVLKGGFDQCMNICANNFIWCTNNAQGTGGWWYCEVTMEACEADCFSMY